MNRIYLSGVIADPPIQHGEGEALKRLVFPLCVSHKTRQGAIKRELYTVQAWNGVAEWARTHLKQGQRVMLQGYLTQHSVRQADGGMRTVVEVTAEEFFPASMPRPATVAQAEAMTVEETHGCASERDCEAQPEAAS